MKTYPTGITPHCSSSTKICYKCRTVKNAREVVEVRPVPGLTLYECRECATKETEQ